MRRDATRAGSALERLLVRSTSASSAPRRRLPWTQNGARNAAPMPTTAARAAAAGDDRADLASNRSREGSLIGVTVVTLNEVREFGGIYATCVSNGHRIVRLTIEGPSEAPKLRALCDAVTRGLMKRLAIVRVFAAGVALTACSDTSAPPVTHDPAPQGIVISNAVSAAGSLGTARAGAARVVAGTVAYISAAPGTFPAAVAVTVQNPATGGSLAALLIDGGFDPLGIAADAGDDLSLTALSDKGAPTASVMIRVPPRRPPTIVRTIPSKGRTDVALNVQIVVVFSEPVTAASVTPSSVALLRQGSSVDGHVDVSSDGLRAQFVPNATLEPGTTYTLVVQREIRDRDGESLSEGSTVTFTTGDKAALEGDLVFAGSIDRNIYRINVDGTGLTKLTNTGHSYNPSWSPDGERIAFITNTPSSANRGFGTSDVYVMNADGSDVVRRSFLRFFNSVAWSPDGRKLAVSDEDVYVAHLYLVSAEEDGSEPVLIATDARTPAWSPDGSRIAYVRTSGDDGYHQVMVMNANGTGAREVTPVDPGGIFGLSWSPGGDRLAFAKCMFGDCGIYLVAVDGSGLTRLPNISTGHSTTWSPDGQWLAITVSPFQQWYPSLAYVSVDGGPLHEIVANGAIPSWRRR